MPKNLKKILRFFCLIKQHRFGDNYVEEPDELKFEVIYEDKDQQIKDSK